MTNTKSRSGHQWVGGEGEGGIVKPHKGSFGVKETLLTVAAVVGLQARTHCGPARLCPPGRAVYRLPALPW